MNHYAIRIEQLSKQYKIGRSLRKENLTDTLRADLSEMVDGAARALAKVAGQNEPEPQGRRQTIWALNDVSFDIQPGESVGVIGSNGAGKTTLLKLISRITVPTSGRIRLHGRVGSLLEVGTGFHTELTGRENIYLNGAILGMRRREIERKFDEIVAFSDIGKFLDTAVKFYSSGMRVRLAFSVAAHLEPEILLIDEVLAVGDIAFQQKSLNKMESVARGGRTVVFVSHNMATVKALCQKAAFIEHGELKFFGPVDEAIAAYLAQGSLQKEEQVSRQPDPSLPMQILSARVSTEDGAVQTRFGHDQPIDITVQCALFQPGYRAFLGVQVVDEDLHTLVNSYDFEMNEESVFSREPGVYTYRIQLPAPLLVPGRYRISLYVLWRSRRELKVLDKVEHVCPFEVYDNGSVYARSGMRWEGQVNCPLEWQEIDKAPLSSLDGLQTDRMRTQ